MKALQKSGKGRAEDWQEAMLWHKERNGVRCDLCAVNCFISKDKLGACNVRKNVSNKLLTVNSKVTGFDISNVEKRPLYHFYPGANSLCISGMGDDNWVISHDRLPKAEKNYTPESIIKFAEQNNIPIISFTGHEPAIFFEFAYRTAKLAHRSNIKTVLVTNGMLTEEAVKKISKYLSAAVVNFRGSGDAELVKKFTLMKDVQGVYSSLKQMKKQRIHIEITNTVIPQVGDSIEKCKKLAEWIAADLSPTFPMHIMQFHPDNKFPDLPFTPIETLEKFADETRRAGLRYVYITNLIQPHEQENTYCYNCREAVVQRVSGMLKKNNLHNDRCGNCGVKMDIIV